MQQQTIENRASQQIHGDEPYPPIGLDRIPTPWFFADPDSSLVQALKTRTPAAFDDLVKQYGCRLLAVAMRITKNREDAEDVVQESFLKIFKKIDSFRGASKFSSWLTQIVINQALMLIRGNPQNLVSIDESTGVGDRTKSLEIRAAGYTPEQLYSQREFEGVMLNWKKVRKSSRRILELRVKHDLSEIEIAQVLNLSLSAVKARLYRGRLDLREAVSRSLDSEKRTRADKNIPMTTGKRAQGGSLVGASALASGNLLPTPSIQPSPKLQSCLPHHIAPQLLTRLSTHQNGGQGIAL